MKETAKIILKAFDVDAQTVSKLWHIYSRGIFTAEKNFDSLDNINFHSAEDKALVFCYRLIIFSYRQNHQILPKLNQYPDSVLALAFLKLDILQQDIFILISLCQKDVAWVAQVLQLSSDRTNFLYQKAAKILSSFLSRTTMFSHDENKVFELGFLKQVYDEFFFSDLPLIQIQRQQFLEHFSENKDLPRKSNLVLLSLLCLILALMWMSRPKEHALNSHHVGLTNANNHKDRKYNLVKSDAPLRVSWHKDVGQEKTLWLRVEWDPNSFQKFDFMNFSHLFLILDISQSMQNAGYLNQFQKALSQVQKHMQVRLFSFAVYDELAYLVYVKALKNSLKTLRVSSSLAKFRKNTKKMSRFELYLKVLEVNHQPKDSLTLIVSDGDLYFGSKKASHKLNARLRILSFSHLLDLSDIWNAFAFRQQQSTQQQSTVQALVKLLSQNTWQPEEVNLQIDWSPEILQIEQVSGEASVLSSATSFHAKDGPLIHDFRLKLPLSISKPLGRIRIHGQTYVIKMSDSWLKSKDFHLVIENINNL